LGGGKPVCKGQIVKTSPFRWRLHISKCGLSVCGSGCIQLLLFQRQYVISLVIPSLTTLLEEASYFKVWFSLDVGTCRCISDCKSFPGAMLVGRRRESEVQEAGEKGRVRIARGNSFRFSWRLEYFKK